MAPNLAAFLSRPLTLGPLQTFGSLTVAPIFGGHSAERLLSLEEAIPLGALARELPSGPVVDRILVSNPTQHLLLLVDGEEIVGARQNRIVDGTVLLAPESESHVRVCCIEEGRWDASRTHEPFEASPQVMSPTLRGVKSRSARGTGRGNQNHVWRQVTKTVMRTRTRTHTGAMTAVFEQHDEALGEIVTSLPRVEGQIGMVVGVGARIWAIDLVADPVTFARMQPRLLRGYAVDAMHLEEAPTLSQAELVLALGRLLERQVEATAIRPLDHLYRFCGEGLSIEGSATVHGERLIALGALLPAAPQGAVGVEARSIRTSETDPIGVSWIPGPRGRLGLTFAPGKTAPSISGLPWSRDLEADLTRLRAQHRVDTMVCLLDDAELKRLGISDYVAEVTKLGFDLHRLPIVDGATPESVPAVRRLVQRLRARLERDERVLVHCAGGLGRAGTIAGCLLKELGLDADQALEALRTRHPRNCPENRAQRRFIRRYTPSPAALVG